MCIQTKLVERKSSPVKGGEDDEPWEDETYVRRGREKSPEELKGDEYDPVTKKFKHFGPDAYRFQGLFSDEEADRFLDHYFSIWEQSLLGRGLDLRTLEGRVHFVQWRANVFGDVLMTSALLVYAESCRHFTLLQNLVVWPIMLHFAGLMFTFIHMSLHSAMLDYHWSAENYATNGFAIMHHRVPLHKHKIDGVDITSTYAGQMLAQTIGTSNIYGINFFEFHKYGWLAVLCYFSPVGRYLFSQFLINFMLEAACHNYIHNQKSVPPVTRLLTNTYAKLGLTPTKQHHMLHHDPTIETRWTNFSDFNLPLVDMISNNFWDWAYHKYYHKGQFTDTAMSFVRSWYVKGIMASSLSLVWLISCGLGIDASTFCMYVPIWLHQFDIQLLDVVLKLNWKKSGEEKSDEKSD